ncbi:MAG TPA: hypothetical protein VF575_05280 [Candidatus Saccharimonadales bacterium]|jgi:hypothetical protein
MKFIIGFLISIGLLIFVFVLIFRGGGDSADQTTKQGTKLIDYANSSSAVMQFTQEGPVTADLTHNRVRITVGRDQTTIETFKGYEGPAVNSKSYANNSTAYADFLQALQLAGYTEGNSDKEFADERGRCATGQRYIMGIQDGSSEIQRFWATSCGGAATFKGKSAIVRSLFIRQVPDYNTVAGNLSL